MQAAERERLAILALDFSRAHPDLSVQDIAETLEMDIRHVRTLLGVFGLGRRRGARTGPRRRTQDRCAQAMRLLDEGRTVAQTALALGVTPQTIYGYMRAESRPTATGAGPRPRIPQELAADREIEVAARYMRGETADEIGRAVGTSKWTVYRALRRRGVEIRPKGRRSKAGSAA